MTFFEEVVIFVTATAPMLSVDYFQYQTVINHQLKSDKYFRSPGPEAPWDLSPYRPLHDDK